MNETETILHVVSAEKEHIQFTGLVSLDTLQSVNAKKKRFIMFYRCAISGHLVEFIDDNTPLGATLALYDQSQYR